MIFDYLWQDGDDQNDAFEDYKHLFALGTESDFDRMHLVTDLIYGMALEEGEGDVFGLVLMPYYDLTDRLEAVLRYTFSSSSAHDGLNVQSRYERAAAGRLKGDEYHAIYAGLNYYICGDKLKLMNGIEYSDISGSDDNSFWSYLTGVRMYF
ncbi:MAG: hypothetical protein AAFZ80_11900 [Cyanobacteria bacterium P01_A01_bin.105]